jgi:hypothetical protein
MNSVERWYFLFVLFCQSSFALVRQAGPTLLHLFFKLCVFLVFLHHCVLRHLQTTARHCPMSTKDYRRDPASVFPVEIIRLVFELAYEPDPAGFQFAYVIMQVSHQWCSLATDCPRIWRWIECDLAKPPFKIKEFWDRMCKRVDGISAIVVLHSVGGGDGSALAACPLTSLRRIESLRLDIIDGNYAKHLLSQNFHPPSASLNSLEFVVGTYRYRQGIAWSHDLLGRFVQVSNLTLVGFNDSFRNHNFHKHPGQDDIHHLCARAIASYAIIPYLHCFQNLLSLDLNLVFYMSGANKVELPRVHTMKVTDSKSWISALSCPAIKTFHVHSIDPNTLDWIKTHKTIEIIGANKVGDWAALAAAAPQLLRLSVVSLPSDIRSMIEQSKLFPQLQVLTIDGTNHPLD